MVAPIGNSIQSFLVRCINIRQVSSMNLNGDIKIMRQFSLDTKVVRNNGLLTLTIFRRPQRRFKCSTPGSNQLGYSMGNVRFQVLICRAVFGDKLRL